MALQPSIPDLAKFLNSCLNAKQVSDLIGMLNRADSAGAALDPEAAPAKPGTGPSERIAVPASIHELLKEMDAAYSIEKNPDPTAEESRRVRDAFPGFIERCSAFQGRHLLKLLRNRLNSI